MPTNQRIDNISELDIASLNGYNFRRKFGTGVNELVDGTYGSREKRYKYRHGVMTEVGDILQTTWCAAARQVVERQGDIRHFGNLKKFLLKEQGKNFYRGPRGELDLETDALNDCLRQLYNDPLWVDFVKYNKKYNPDILRAVPFSTITIECCNLPVNVPRVQIDEEKHALWDTEIYCPICGRHSKYQIVAITAADKK